MTQSKMTINDAKQNTAKPMTAKPIARSKMTTNDAKLMTINTAKLMTINTAKQNDARQITVTFNLNKNQELKDPT